MSVPNVVIDRQTLRNIILGPIGEGLRAEIGSDGPGLALLAWDLVAEVSPSGMLQGVPPETLARHLEWNLKPALLVDALRKSGFVDINGRIVGWKSQLGTWTQKRSKAARQKRWREQKRRPHVDVYTEPSAPERRPKVDVYKSHSETGTERPTAKKKRTSVPAVRSEAPGSLLVKGAERIRVPPSEGVSETLDDPKEATAVSPPERKKPRVDTTKVAARAAARVGERAELAAESRAALEADRARFGVTVERVPAAAIDKGAGFAFPTAPGELANENLEQAIAEARRGFARYRRLCGDSGASHLMVPLERAERLAVACASHGLSVGRVLESLHAQARKLAGTRSVPLTMISPAALDAACLAAAAPGKSADPTKRAAGVATGYLDHGRLDPRILPALEAAGMKPPPLATKASWALHAQIRAENLSRGRKVGWADEETEAAAKIAGAVLRGEA